MWCAYCFGNGLAFQIFGLMAPLWMHSDKWGVRFSFRLLLVFLSLVPLSFKQFMLQLEYLEVITFLIGRPADFRASTSGEFDPGERISRFMTAQNHGYAVRLPCADDGVASEAGFLRRCPTSFSK